MKMILIACVLLLSAGCVIIQTGKSDRYQADQMAAVEVDLFHEALDQLLSDNNPEPMQAFVRSYPESNYLYNAKGVLKLHSSNDNIMKNIESCDQKLEDSKQIIKKLQEDIERMTQLNLEMDRSSP